jgi:hypothetical protein
MMNTKPKKSFILTWNGRGEIVYRGHNIQGTDIVDLLKYCVTPYHPDIPEPTGLSIGYFEATRGYVIYSPRRPAPR